MDKLSLKDKKGLIIGIANNKSIAYGCARVMREAGAELAITYLNEKAETYVRPLAESLKAPITMPCNVQNDAEMKALFTAINKKWGNLDFLIHSIAYAPKSDLQGRVVDSSSEGFLEAMDISCHSFVRMAKLAEPLMKNGGNLITMSYYGAEKVVDRYSIMGPVKAALESSVRYMAAELGEKKIRVNAISPGAIQTRAAGGIPGFDSFLETSKRKSPLHRLIDIDDIGNMAAFLASDAAKNITGQTLYIDAGYEVMD